MNFMKDSEPWYMRDNKVFVSYPKYKFFVNDWGFYILPSYYYRLFPKFYYMKTKYFIELGFSFAGYNFEIQNNKIEKVK